MAPFAGSWIAHQRAVIFGQQSELVRSGEIAETYCGRGHAIAIQDNYEVFSMERFIPSGHRSGFNTLSGEARCPAVAGDIGVATATGQQVTANLTVVASQEQMLESLNVSVEASGHHGLSSAEERFSLAQPSR